MMQCDTYTVLPEQENIRIDKFLSETIPDLSRSYIQKLLSEHAILVNQAFVKANYKLRTGDRIQITLPEPREMNLIPEDIPLDIVYEDNDILIINKPKDMVVHPAAGHDTGTLVHGVLYHCNGQLSSINGVLRPGIVHRIDKDTTGLLVVCKNDLAHQSLAEQLKVHSITRTYYAIVYDNIIEEEGTVDQPIGRHPVDRKKQSIDLRNGRNAVTHYRVLERFHGKYTLIECRLETGRTHQIRVHMASIGHPLLGDEIYGRGKSLFSLQGQALHAMVLGVIHPSTGKYLEVEAPLPEYFLELLGKLRRNNGI